MAKLHSTAISCAETGNGLIADHCRSVCKLTEPNISKARLLCCTQRAPAPFPLPFFTSRAALLEQSSAVHQPTATLASQQRRDKRVLFLSLSSAEECLQAIQELQHHTAHTVLLKLEKWCSVKAVSEKTSSIQLSMAHPVEQCYCVQFDTTSQFRTEYTV